MDTPDPRSMPPRRPEGEAPQGSAPPPPPPLDPRVGVWTAPQHPSVEAPGAVAAVEPRRRRGLVISLVIAGVLALALVGTGAVIATRVLGWGVPSSRGLAAMEDIRTLPEEEWNYSYGDRRIPDLAIIDAQLLDEDDFVLLLASPFDSSSPRIVRVDGQNGEERWSVDLASIGFPEGELPNVLPLSPEGHLPIATTVVQHGGGPMLWMSALDLESGEVLSQVELNGYHLASESVWRSPPFSTSRDGKDTSYSKPVVVGRTGGAVRLDTADLGGAPAWEVETGDVISIDQHAGFVNVETATTEYWLDQETGHIPDWFEGQGSSRDFLPGFMPDVLRTESIDGEFFDIDGLDSEGKVRWTAEIATPLEVRTSGGTALFSAELADGEFAGYYEYLVRIDPSTGERMWDTEFREPFTSPGEQAVAGQLTIHQDGDTLLLDLATGEETHRLRGSVVGVGTRVLYTFDEQNLRAWDAKSGEELWSVRLGDEAEVFALGSMLAVDLYGRGELVRLR